MSKHRTSSEHYSQDDIAIINSLATPNHGIFRETNQNGTAMGFPSQPEPASSIGQALLRRLFESQPGDLTFPTWTEGISVVEAPVSIEESVDEEEVLEISYEALNRSLVYRKPKGFGALFAHKQKSYRDYFPVKVIDIDEIELDDDELL